MFGEGNSSFRLYSAACFAVAFVLLWFTVRRFYSRLVAFFAVLTGWCLSPVLLSHTAEGRFYGLFVCTSLGVIWFVLDSVDRPRPGLRSHAAAFLLFSLLVTSHILGVCYSACLLLGWIAIDTLQGLRRKSMYLAALASWIWLLPMWPAIHAAAEVGKPRFWTSQPNLFTFVLGYVGSSLRAAMIVATLLLLVAILLIRRFNRSALLRGLQQRAPILIVMGALFLIPILFWLEGFIAAPLFNARYMQPVSTGTVILIAELVTQIDTLWLRMRRYRDLAVGLVMSATLAMVLQYEFVYLPHFVDARPVYAASLTSRLPAHVPVVCEDAFTFTELMREEPSSPVRYVYLLDWDHSVNPSSPRLEVTQFHLMQNWRRVGYYPDHIRYRDEFLSQTPYFLVMRTTEDTRPTILHAGGPAQRDEMIGNPFTRRFAADPAYRELPFLSLKFGDMQERLSLVCRKDLDCSAIRAKHHTTSQTR